MPKRSTKPIADTLHELMDERDWTLRELSRQTKQHGWGSPGALSFLFNGEQPPTIRAMEALAKALKVPPETFAEYRLAKAREQLDERVVGFKTALANLEGRSRQSRR